MPTALRTPSIAVNSRRLPKELVACVLLFAMAATAYAAQWTMLADQPTLHAFGDHLRIALIDWLIWLVLVPAIMRLARGATVVDRPSGRWGLYVAILIGSVIVQGICLSLALGISGDADSGFIATLSDLLRRKIGVGALVAGALIAIAARSPGHVDDLADESFGPLRTVALRTGDGTRFVQAADVIWLESAGNYVVVHLQRERAIVRGGLGELIDEMGDWVVRASRSVAVNPNAVRSVRPLGRGDQLLTLADDSQVKLSRTHRSMVLARMTPAA